MTEHIETLDTAFVAAGHERVDPVRFATAMFARTLAAIARQLASGGMVPAQRMALLAAHLGDPAAPSGESVAAYVNVGRWLGRCPDCGGCEHVDFELPIFMCASCWNVANGYQWRAITLPGEREAIEGALLRRPQKANRNWTPKETASDLVVENREMGVEAV